MQREKKDQGEALFQTRLSFSLFQQRREKVCTWRFFEGFSLHTRCVYKYTHTAHIGTYIYKLPRRERAKRRRNGTQEEQFSRRIRERSSLVTAKRELSESAWASERSVAEIARARESRRVTSASYCYTRIGTLSGRSKGRVLLLLRFSADGRSLLLFFRFPRADFSYPAVYSLSAKLIRPDAVLYRLTSLFLHKLF